MSVIKIKNSSALTHCLGAEHYNFNKDVVKGIATDITQVPDVLPSFNLYKQRADFEGVIFKLSPESEETVKITFLNKKRVGNWRLIVRTLDYHDEYQEGALQTAAKHLNHVIKTYKGLTDANLFARTGYISDAIDALHESSAQAAVALIPGLLSLVDELEALNTELDDLYIKREQDNGLVRGLGTLGEYRPQVDKAFLDLVEDLNSTHRLNELSAKNATLKAAIEKVANTINSLYNKLLEVLAHRHAGKKNPQKPGPGENGGGGSEGGDGGGEGSDGGGEGGDPGDGGETPGGGTENPDIENPPPPPFLPDFE